MPIKNHSERIPNKNFRQFMGKPLYFYILKTLLSCKHIKQIIINTDSKKINKQLWTQSKIEISPRPQKLCGDNISMNKIITYEISRIDPKNPYFLQTHVTNPLLKRETIDSAIEQFFRLKKYDSLFSVTKLQTRLYDNKVKPINHNPNKLIRTQDLKPIYEENSNFYIFSRHSFIKNKHKRIGNKPQIFEINKIEAIDIDTKEDFTIAETIYKSITLTT